MIRRFKAWLILENLNILMGKYEEWTPQEQDTAENLVRAFRRHRRGDPDYGL